MAKFFSKYPKILINSKIATDLLARSTILNNLISQAALYYDYNLQEGDTPEIIAEKYYGDPELHWVIMIVNNIVDNTFDLPLSYENFILYLDNKYKSQGESINRSGSEYAKLTLNLDPGGYIGVIKTTDTISGIVTEQKYYIDELSYTSQYDNPVFNFNAQSYSIDNIIYEQYTEQMSIYDWEEQKNESKREIKILNKNYISQFIDQFELLMKVKYG